VSAQGGMRAQELIGKGFLTMPPEDLEDALRSVGHRFAYQRARFILENRQRAHLLPLKTLKASAGKKPVTF